MSASNSVKERMRSSVIDKIRSIRRRFLAYRYKHSCVYCQARSDKTQVHMETDQKDLLPPPYRDCATTISYSAVTKIEDEQWLFAED